MTPFGLDCFAWIFYLLDRSVASYSLPMLKVIFLDHALAVPPHTAITVPGDDFRYNFPSWGFPYFALSLGL